jgi:hypothetical protein
VGVIDPKGSIAAAIGQVVAVSIVDLLLSVSGIL